MLAEETFQGRHRSPSRLARVYYVAAKLSVISFVGFMLSISLPFNPLSEHLRGESIVKSFVPEGWAFFTRDPREERLEVVYRVGGRWVPNPLVPMGKLSNELGLWRKVRAQSVEIAMLLPQVRKDQWIEHPKGFWTSVVTSSKSQEVVDTSPYPVLPDTIAIVKHEPIPWSYARMITVDSLPCRYVVLAIRKSVTKRVASSQ